VTQDFQSFFRRATGHVPYGYQTRLARDGLPDLVSAPTGAGKTAVILAWLWRRLHGPDPAATPRRLIYALPPRSVLDEVSGPVRTWLERLELTDEVALHVAAGDGGANYGNWRENMHKPAVVVGTAETLVAKALNRGYGIGRAMYPIDFALVTNGAQWIVDEPGLCPVATATLRQLARWCGDYGTAEPFGMTDFSSLPLASAAAVGDRGDGEVREVVRIVAPERTGELAARLDARRTIRRAPWAPGDYPAVAAAVRGLHRAGTLTLVLLDTVPGAQAVYRGLRGGTVTLLHSQLRGVERAARLAEIEAAPADRIVVATGDVVSGLDQSAAVLVTEAAPWPALVRRAGRANRTGTVPNAEVWWVPPSASSSAAAPPSHRQAVAAACAELARLEGTAVTTEDLAARAVESAPDAAPDIDPADFSALFDTAAPPAGPELDIGRYVRDAEEPDVDVAWVTWTPGPDGGPDPEVRYPAPRYRCRVPIGQAVRLAESRPVWYFDQSTGQWRRTGQDPQWQPRPYDLLLVAAANGGYDSSLGFDPSAQGLVPDSPELLTPDEIAARAATDVAGLEAAPEESFAPPKWQSLDEHSEQVRDQAAALLTALAPDIGPQTARAAILAGYLHDVGKAHPIWQDALCAMADEAEVEAVTAGRPWAKSGRTGRLEFAGGVSFRHELASVLLVDGPLHDVLAGTPEPDLVRYLILAHHGRLRVRVGDPGAPADPVDSVDPVTRLQIRGLSQGAAAAIPPMLGHPASTLVVDLEQFSPDSARPDSARSWESAVLALRDRLGPFILAYLETLVRMADWRASGGWELASNNNATDITCQAAPGTPE
jgi:CRISPR-associated endonuclease/helicase Cas3